MPIEQGEPPHAHEDGFRQSGRLGPCAAHGDVNGAAAVGTAQRFLRKPNRTVMQPSDPTSGNKPQPGRVVCTHAHGGSVPDSGDAGAAGVRGGTGGRAQGRPPRQGVFLGPHEDAVVARVPRGEPEDVMLGRRAHHGGPSPAWPSAGRPIIPEPQRRGREVGWGRGDAISRYKMHETGGALG